MINRYDIKKQSETFADGVPTTTFTVRDTRNIDVRPIRKDEALYTIELGGIKYTPQFRGFVSIDTTATASDRITQNSGTTDLLILRTYEYEDHKEFDLMEVSD